MGRDYSPFLILATMFSFFVLLGVVGEQDQKHQVAAQSDYCQMVTLWKQDEAAGIKPVNRAGWPDFRENFDLTCDGFQVANSTPMR